MKLSSVLFYNTYFPCSLFNEALILSLTKFEDVINAERIEKNIVILSHFRFSL